MARLLGILLLLGLGWLLLRPLFAARKRTHHASAQRFEKTVRCERCGVHLPMSLARIEDGRHVCADPECRSKRAPDREP